MIQDFVVSSDSGKQQIGHSLGMGCLNKSPSRNSWSVRIILSTSAQDIRWWSATFSVLMSAVDSEEFCSMLGGFISAAVNEMSMVCLTARMDDASELFWVPSCAVLWGVHLPHRIQNKTSRTDYSMLRSLILLQTQYRLSFDNLFYQLSWKGSTTTLRQTPDKGALNWCTICIIILQLEPSIPPRSVSRDNI